MAHRLAVFLACVSLVAGALRCASAAPACDESLWSHVFSPSRLHVLDRCVVVRGTVVLPMPQLDGDYHILVRLDPSFQKFDPDQSMINVEAMCMIPVVQSGPAVDACAHWHQNIQIPPPGTHVDVVGAWVDDGEHGWQEIHPVTAMVARASA
jgi:hypothetical protein